jgi:hypothetical protein
MEELQSTEALEREILEDARKKAAKILKNAADTILAKSSEWEKKTAATLDALDKKFAAQGEASEREIMIRLPLDKRRAKIQRIEKMLESAVDSWYLGLGRAKVIELLKTELVKRLKFCGDFQSWETCLFGGLEHAEAEAIIGEALGKNGIPFREIPPQGKFPEIILETKSARITSSINQIVRFFLSEKRKELTEALLGSEALAWEDK